MPQDPREQFEQYEKERHELETQIKFLEDEVALLRRRLSNAPRQVKLLEERLLQSRADLSKALAQNEKLVSALKAERDKIEALKEEVEKLTQPPATFGVFLAMVEDEDSGADVFTAGRKMRVSVDPSLDRARLRKGVEVILNEALNVVEILDQDRQGEVVTVKEHVDDDRVIVIGRGDESQVAMLSESLRDQVIRVGDSLLLDPRSGHALEKLPKQEIEELVLEEVPDISYEDIGGLGRQIEAIRDAVELPFLYSELQIGSCRSRRSRSSSSRRFPTSPTRTSAVWAGRSRPSATPWSSRSCIRSFRSEAAEAGDRGARPRGGSRHLLRGHRRSGQADRGHPRRRGAPVPVFGASDRKLPKQEIEELVLEEVPDISYEDIGGLGRQIEAIRDAVELPFLYSELQIGSCRSRRSRSSSSRRFPTSPTRTSAVWAGRSRPSATPWSSRSCIRSFRSEAAEAGDRGARPRGGSRHLLRGHRRSGQADRGHPRRRGAPVPVFGA